MNTPIRWPFDRGFLCIHSSRIDQNIWSKNDQRLSYELITFIFAIVLKGIVDSISTIIKEAAFQDWELSQLETSLKEEVL